MRSPIPFAGEVYQEFWRDDGTGVVHLYWPRVDFCQLSIMATGRTLGEAHDKAASGVLRHKHDLRTLGAKLALLEEEIERLIDAL
jgi:hypothetical protein